MRVDKNVQKVLDEVGAILIRSTHHLVYRIPGASALLTIGGTCSDQRAVRNQIAQIRRLLKKGKENAI